MKLFKFSILVAAFTASQSTCLATDFFSTDKPEDIMEFGIHTGINTSVRTVGDIYNFWNYDSWGTGYDLGFTADINLRDYISVQPGFFYHSRSGTHAYAMIYTGANGTPEEFVDFGSYRSYNITIPLLARGHFNISNDVRWNVDFGPYVSLRMGTTGSDKRYLIDPNAAETLVPAYSAHPFEFGFKMGTSITVLKNYNFGIHYLAGATNVWKGPSLKGRTKMWTFDLGYNF